jgi:hypothetical protein
MDTLWEDKCKPMVERDLFIRDAIVKRGDLNDTYHPEMEKVHLENARKLQDLIHKNGFPVLSNAGAEGVRLSWLIIQHSISCADFMRESLTQMRLAAAAHDYPLDLLAYTEDRVAYFEGRGQLYGTNLDWQDGDLKPTLIEDKDHVDARRKSVGLPPLRQDMVTHERPPADPEKKEKEFQLWLKKTGWRI